MFKVGDLVQLNECGKGYYYNNANSPHEYTGVVQCVTDLSSLIYWETGCHNWINNGHLEATDVEKGNPFKVGDYAVAKDNFYSVLRKVTSINRFDVYLDKSYFGYSSFSLQKITETDFVGWGSLIDISIRHRDEDLLEFLSNSGHKIDGLMSGAFQPFRSKSFPGNISIYPDRTSYDRKREVSMKPGRAFRKLLPDITDKEIALLVDKFNQKFGARKFTLKVGDKAEDFKRAYSHTQAARQNPYTTINRKSLSNSCMRYKFDDVPIHPCEVYASGDFKIVYLEDHKGHIGGRCVVYVNHSSGGWQAGPVYGVCETSLDQIVNYLKDNNAKLYPDSNWHGAKLNRVPYNHGGFVGPYIDGYEFLKDEGDYLVISTYGDIACDTYSGILNGCGHLCYHCEESFNEGELYYQDGEHYCDDCLNENFSYCEFSSEYISQEDAIIYISYRSSNGYTYTNQCHSDYVGDRVFQCQISDEYYIDDLITFDTYNEQPAALHLVERDWLYDEEECFYFPPEEGTVIKYLDGTEKTVYTIPSNFVEGNQGIYYEREEAA